MQYEKQIQNYEIIQILILKGAKTIWCKTVNPKKQKSILN